MKVQLVLTYWRCLDCLEAFTLQKGVTPDECSCGGKPEEMGDVATDHTVEDRVKAPCDSRCTNAQGPLCFCKCMCANHGTGRLVRVKLVDGRYKVQHFSKKNLQFAKEFREALEACKTKFFAKYGSNIESYAFIKDRSKWWEIKTAQRQFEKFKALRVHKKRMAALNQFLEGLIASSKDTQDITKQLEG